MSADHDFQAAKAFLQKGGPTGLNLYDHLSSLIAKVLEEKPANSVEILEDLSKQLKQQKFAAGDTLKDKPAVSAEANLASAQVRLFKTEETEDAEDADAPVGNLPEFAALFEETGVGLGREESLRVFLALKRLVEVQPLKKASFWGKIFGIQGNYYVAEAEYKDGEEPQSDEPDAGAGANAKGVEEGEEDGEKKAALPASKFKPLPPLPKEDYGAGTNKKAYFVTSEPGLDWVALPNVTPDQVAVARQIRKFFTGKLDAAVVSYPPFPGREAELLRAQIARITAGTHVSPAGLYTFEEGDDEDEAARENFIEDEEFEGKTRTELVDEELTGWVHHAAYILPQGRCKWVNPSPKSEEEAENEDEENEEEESEEVEPESGPPLLTPLQSDAKVDGMAPWSARISLRTHAAYAAVRISSNRWPGAHAVAVPKTKRFANVYVGWGQKFSSDLYAPPLPPKPESEYPNGEDIAEAVDPTREEEEQFEASQAAKEGDGEEAEEAEAED